MRRAELGKKVLSVFMTAMLVTQSYAMPVQSAYAASGEGDQEIAVEKQEDQAGGGESLTKDDSSATDSNSATIVDATTAPSTNGAADPTVDANRGAAGEAPVSMAVPQSADEQPVDDRADAVSDVSAREIDEDTPKESSEIVIENPASSKVAVGLFTDANRTQPLGNQAVSADQTIYAHLEIDFAGDETPSTNKETVIYVFPDNVSTITSGEKVLRDADGNEAGTYEIRDNRLYFRYNNSWLKAHPTGIKASADFDFTLNGNGLKDGDEVPIAFPGTGTTVTVPVKDGKVDGDKCGQANSDGTITWTINLNVASTAKNVTLNDVLGDNLSYVEGSFKLDGQTVSPSIDGQNAIFSLGDLSKGSHTLTYTTSIKQSALDSLKNGDKLSDAGNKAQWSWGSDNNRQTSEEKNVDPPNGGLSYSMVSKSASGDSTPEDITWTATLNNGSLKADMAGYIFRDTLDANQTYKGSYEVKDASGKTVKTGSLPSDGSSFTYEFPSDAGKQQYTIVYHTQMKDASLLDSVTNTAEVKPSNGMGPEGSGVGTFKPKDNNEYVKKEFVADDGDGYLRWKSTILTSNMSTSTDPTTVELKDRIDGTVYQQMAIDQIEVSADGIDLVRGEDYTVSDNNYWNEFSVTLKDTQKIRELLGKKDITVTYRTKSNNANDIYTNKATVKTSTATASYTVKNAPQVQKDGNLTWDPSFDWSTVDGTTDKGAWVANWTVLVNAYKKENNWAGLLDLGGQPVNVSDVLPSNMVYVSGSSQASLKTRPWETVGAAQIIEPTNQDGTLSWSIPTAAAGGSVNPVYVELTYKTAAKASAVSTEGKAQFTNAAQASSGKTTFPEGSKTVEADNKVLTKDAWQVANSSAIRYDIKVNETALDLVSDSDTVTLTDTMDSACTFLPPTLKIYRLENGQRGAELAVSEYKATANEVAGGKTQLTLELPDSTPLEVVYEVKPSGKQGDQVSLTNEASLAGVAGGTSQHSKTWTIQRDSASTEGTGYGITITKLDKSDLSKKLAGATFDLYAVDMDAAIAGKDLSTTSEHVASSKTSESGQASFGSEAAPLKSDTLYWYQESAAPEGYKLDGTKHFFMLKGGEFDSAKAKVEQLAQALNITIDLKTATSYNAYDEKTNAAPTSLALTATKSLDGRDLADGEFEFQLKDADGNVLQTKTNDADGNVAFGAIDYTAAGTYTYTVSEVAGSEDGVSYDPTVYTVVVEVAEKDGQLVATPVYKKGDAAADQLAFANTYTAPAATSHQLAVKKHLEGRDFKDGETFMFELKDAQGTVLQTKEVSSQDQSVDFDAINYDEPGDYTYTISEVAGDAVNTSYDTAAHRVVVHVKKDGNKLVASSDCSHDNPLTITNGYTKPAAVKATIEGSKSLTGRDLKAGEFEFKLRPKDGTAGDEQTATNDVQGKFAFDLSYDQPGTYQYTVTEVAGNEAGVTYDGASFGVTVTVTEADGKYIAEVAYDDGPVAFANTYAPKGSSAQLVARKTLDGRALEEGEFEFQLKDAAGNVLQTKTNDAFGSVAFDAIGYTAAGTYTYTISEVKGTEDRVTYDTAEHKVTVNVVDKDGQLVATPSYDNGSDAAPEFKNSYQVKSTTVSLEAKKTLTGRTLKDGEFEFRLNPVDGAPGEAQTVRNDADGKVQFGQIDLAEPGSYKYEVSEVKPASAENGMDYDDSVYTVTVNVENKDNAGQLVATVDYGTQSDAAPEFANAYTATGSATLAVQKTVNGSAPAANAKFDFELSAETEGAPLPERVTTSTFGGAQATFGTLSFSAADAGKTYNYKISEADDLGLGWTRANDVQVEVTMGSMEDSSNGVLPVSVRYVGQADDAQDAAAFNNLYTAPSGAVSFSVAKTVNGGAPAEGKTFTFSAKSGDANAPQLSDVTTDAAGNATFSATLAEANMGHEYTYTVHEESQLPGYTNASDQTVKLVVSSELDADGNIWASVEYPDGSDSLVFNNAYDASGTAAVHVRKTVNGVDTDKSFEFQLLEDGEVIRTVTTNGSADAAFGNLEYSLADAGQTHVYTIHEVTPATVGWTNAADQTVTVQVGDDQGDGTLAPSTIIYEDESADAAVMNNTYEQASGSFQLGLVKTVNGEAPFSGEKFGFSATSADEGAPAIANVTTDADGSATFAEVALSDADEGKTYTYTIHEVTSADDLPGDGTWTLAPDVTATVKVSQRDENNQLHATVSYSNTGDSEAESSVARFDNGFKAAPVSTTLKVQKRINGSDASDEQQEFKFDLQNNQGDTIAATSVKGTGEASFGELSYSKPGTYKYTIHEEELGGGWFNAPDVPVTVEVGYAQNGRDLEVKSVSYGSDATAQAAVFDNVHASASAAIKVSKKVNGEKSGDYADKEFAFDLLDEDGKQAGSATVKGTGEASFGELSYAEPGEYRYTIHETSDFGPGWTNAQDATMTVKVERDEANRTLKATVDYGDRADGDASAALFDNAYEQASGSFQLGLAKTVNGEAPLAGEEFEFSATSADEGAPELGNATTDADGNATFDAANLADADEGKTYTYTIHEVTPASDLPGDGGWTLAPDVTATVKVSQRDEDNKLHAEVVYSSATSDGPLASFDNQYQVKTVSVRLGVKKLINGAEAPDVQQEFKFDLLDEDGKQTGSATVKGTGEVSFGGLSFDAPGEYKYTIHEEEVGADWQNAPDATVTVKVEHEADGRSLKASVDYGNRAYANGAEAVFDNTHHVETPHDETPHDEGKKTTRFGGLAQTGDPLSLASAAVAGSAGLSFLAASLHRRRRRK